MNLREGTRRLALLLGVVGAILGGFASYLELQPVLSQRARHNRFERLSASDVVKQERKRLETEPNDWQDVPGFGPPESDPGAVVKPHDVPKSFIPDKPKYTIENADGTPLASEVNKGGIGTIKWSHNYGVESIETQGGQTVYPTPAPSAWMYLLIALFPILGFFIPWSAVRAIGWVGAGFIARPK